MGIPQLRRRLEHLAKRAVIEPSSVVVDGPSLAYHILSLCLKANHHPSPFDQPSYGLLGKTASAWLSRLQECGLSISAIYFDSYLPSSKRAERIQRLIKSTQYLIKYHSKNLAGVPNASNQASDAVVDLFPTSPPGKGKPPPPAFLVPAVIDALRNSPDFGHLVTLVPGEADGFCADHVRQNGGTVFTSDSDLLVYDLGQDGGVIFFEDIEPAPEKNKLVALQYRPSALCERLSIKPDTGFQWLAFQVNRDSHLTLPKAIERAMREASPPSQAEYTEFLTEYLSPEVATSPETSQVTALDPRVSELVLRSLRIPERTTSPSNDDNDNELEMYLPILLDCPTRTSAWEASKPVRHLAYALLQHSQRNRIPFVSEMRRLQSAHSGLRIDVPHKAEVDKLATSLLALFAKIEFTVRRPELVWVVLAVYQDIVMTADRGRGVPLSIETLRQDAEGKLDTCSWPFIHFLAQVQATLYSLRVLRQILDYTASHHKPLSPPMSDLQRYLSRLPPLADFPSPRSFAATVRSVREAGGLPSLEDLCADHEDIISHIGVIRGRPRNGEAKERRQINKSKKRKAMESAEEKPRARSNNPFDLLAGSE